MKIKIKKSIAILVLAMFCRESFSQVKAITIGEQCPDVMIPHIINYTTDRASIADFRGKLLILDFWATWCGPCVSMLPVADSLQKQFENKIQFLAVTEQEETTVVTFFRNMQKNKNVSIPTATGDKELDAFFPHVVIPHYVWIDGEGKVLAITGAEQVTAAVIEDFLQKKNIMLPVKVDSFKTIDENAPMFVTGNELIEGDKKHFEKIASTDVLYHSVITKYIAGFGSEQSFHSEKITCKNTSLGDLYRVAAGKGKLVNMEMNSTIWETQNPAVKLVTDSASMIHNNSRAEIDSWMEQYNWCYELQLPDVMKDKKFELMLQDLNNYFGAIYNITGGLERRNIKCLALVVTDKNKTGISNAAKNQYTIDDYHLQLRDGSMNELLGLLSINLDTMPPLIDETGYTNKIDIELKCKMSDLTSVNKALNAYGLQLVEKMAEHDMIVIKDKPSQQ